MMVQAKMRMMISHAYDEKELAEAWKELIETISAHAIAVWFSSDLRGAGGMTPGENWRRDLEHKLSENNLILAIQTPTSATHTWIVWECGIAHGLHTGEAIRKRGMTRAFFSGREALSDHGVIPVVYAMKRGDIANPLNSYQVYEGEDPAQVRQVCEYLVKKIGLELDSYLFEKAFTTYQKTVEAFRPPEQVTHEQINVWRTRFAQLIEAGRTSEIPSTRRRMYTSLVTPFKPVEPGIHEMLSRILLSQGYYHDALQEIDYALCLLKDDTDLLYRKALAEVELQNLQNAEEVINRLFSLNQTLVIDPEIASLAGRILRERWILTQDSAKLDGAITAYLRAYEANPTQYYPGINAAELLLAKGDVGQADRIFHELLSTCQQHLGEQVVSYWVDFTLGATYLGLEEVTSAKAAYQKGLQRSPSSSPRERKSALKGARRMIELKKLPAEVAEEIEELLS